MKTHTHVLLTLIITMVALLLLSGCAGASKASSSISIEGEVWTRGNVPFTAYVLTTDQQNHYILNLEDAVSISIVTPAWVQVILRSLTVPGFELAAN